MAKKALQINPFVQSLVIRCKWDLKKTTEAGYAQVIRTVPIEVDHRVAVYTEHLVSLFSELDKGGLRLFSYVCAHLRWGQDYLQLEPLKVAEALGMARATYYAALQSLTNKVLVKRETSNNTYFINPMYIYCGKRHVDFKDHIMYVNTNPLDKVTGDKEPTSGDSVPVTTIPGAEWTRQPHLMEP